MAAPTIEPEAEAGSAPAPGSTRSGLGDRLSRLLYARPKLRLTALLTLPLAWLGVLYIGSLILLFITAFWTTDSFTSKVIPAFTLENFIEILTVPAYQLTALRTIGIALAVTVLCAVLALPLGFYMAKVASPRMRAVLAIGITLPLWAGYLVKVFSWRITFMSGGPLDWLLAPLGMTGPGYGAAALVITLAYLWFPYMAVPVYSAFRQIPDNLFDASSDLGAKAWSTVRTVAIPLLKPAFIAGSIFTFSLSLATTSPRSSWWREDEVIGTVIASNINLNPPLAAAFGTVPIVVVVLDLFLARKSGALSSFRSRPMRLSSSAKVTLRVFAGPGDGRHLPAVAAGDPQLLQRHHLRCLPDHRVHHPLVGGRLPQRGRARGPLDLAAGGRGGHRDRAAAGQHDRVRALPLRILRQEHREPAWWCCPSRCPASSPASR